MKELRRHGTESAARHDDRALRTEGTSRANRDGRRNRLKESDFWFNPAPVQQDGLNRFGNSMSANTFRPVARHKTDNQATYHWHQNDKPSQVMAGGTHHVRLKSLIEEQVGKQPDQLEQ